LSVPASCRASTAHRRRQLNGKLSNEQSDVTCKHQIICKGAGPRREREFAGTPGRAAARLAVSTLVLACLSCAAPGAAHASIGQALSTTLRDMAPDWVVIIVLAALPLIELRGAIPVGIVLFQLNPALVLLLACLGNMLPVPIIMSALGPLARGLEGFPRLYNAFQRILERADSQARDWGSGNVFWALAFFVGVPLPGTGAWSGAIVAWVLGMPFVDGLLANGAGVVIAGILVSVLSCMGWAGFWTAAVVLLVIPVMSFLVRSIREDPVR
jgi:uncharacterized membrane protein